MPTAGPLLLYQAFIDVADQAWWLATQCVWVSLRRVD